VSTHQQQGVQTAVAMPHGVHGCTSSVMHAYLGIRDQLEVPSDELDGRIDERRVGGLDNALLNGLGGDHGVHLHPIKCWTKDC